MSENAEACHRLGTQPPSEEPTIAPSQIIFFVSTRGVVAQPEPAHAPGGGRPAGRCPRPRPLLHWDSVLSRAAPHRTPSNFAPRSPGPELTVSPLPLPRPRRDLLSRTSP